MARVPFPPKRLFSVYYDNNATPSLLYFRYKLGVNHQDCLKKEIL